MAHVLVVDDEPSICWAFRNFLGDDGHRVTVASTAEKAIESQAADPPDVMLLDVRLPGMDGITALDVLRRGGSAFPVIVMTAHGDVSTAVGAVRAGAFDYLPKPFDLADARRMIARALQTSKPSESAAPIASLRGEPGEPIGRGPAMQSVFKKVAMAAACDEPVLITGESGTGKELVARSIHRHSDRSKGPFVAVHLAAMPEGLVERELFGHEKGAFTGADASRSGLLDLAAGGTILFDEVAEAPLGIQAKLLRVLDGGGYRPVGGGAERTLRARVIAATNRDLADWVRTGAFRADLYYRMAVLPIPLPPLRDRPEDIAELWGHFLGRLRPGADAGLDRESAVGRIVLAHDWPGNVRELRNVAEHAARASRGAPIHPEHLPATLLAAPSRPSDLDAAIERWVRSRPAGDEPGTLHDEFIAAVEAPLLREIRAWAGGNQARMARRLGLHRTTLRQKLRQLGLEPSGES